VEYASHSTGERWRVAARWNVQKIPRANGGGVGWRRVVSDGKCVMCCGSVGNGGHSDILKNVGMAMLELGVGKQWFLKYE
jgi:hypothetical protein